MYSSIDRDPRPSNLSEMVKKFRKVPPLKLEGSALISNGAMKSGNPAARSNSGLAEYSGSWEVPQVTHLLRRTLFGIKKSDLDLFQTLTLSQAVNQLLTASPSPAPPKNYYSGPGSGVEDPDVAFGETWVNAPYNNGIEGRRINSLKSWLINHMISQEATLSEKMLLFWHNLLATESWGVFIAKASYQYFETLRRHSFGNFKELIRDITLDPAMLIYLNGTRNNKEAPDENYARELQELFCIGKGPNSAYTESDVQAAARVLTGWRHSWEQVNSEGPIDSFFDSNRHETTDKQFSEFYGNRLIQGREGEQGAEELDELLEMLFDNQETARYLSRRLYQFFVYSEIDQAAEQSVIQPMADILRTSNYDVLPALSALLKSEHFFDPVNFGAAIKSPIDHLVGLWRTLGVVSPDPMDPVLTDSIGQSMIWNMANKGLEIADPPSVSGWPAYYQAPQYDKAWITTDTISSRATTGDSLVYWGFWVNSELQIPADLVKFTETLSHPEDPNKLISETVSLFLGINLADNELAQLKSILLSGQLDDHYWSNAWSDHINNPGDMEYRLTVETRLKSFYQRLFQRGEFHLM